LAILVATIRIRIMMIIIMTMISMDKDLFGVVAAPLESCFLLQVISSSFLENTNIAHCM